MMNNSVFNFSRIPGLILILSGFFGSPLAWSDSGDAGAETLYISQQTSLLDAPRNGDIVADITPGTMIRVIQHDDEWLQVEMMGWSPEGGEKYLFREIGQRIRLAKITEQGLTGRTVVDEKEDYYESVWLDVRLTGWLDIKNTTAELGDIWKTARDLFHQRCTRCHALHRPTEFTANQWPAILKIMTVRAGLSDDMKSLIVQYMQTHAKDQETTDEPDDEIVANVVDPSKAKITGDSNLASLGGKLYKQRSCNACHGDAGRVPVIPAYPKLAGQNADYLFKQMQDFSSRSRGNDEYEMMKQNLVNVPEDERKALAYWLSLQ